MTIEYKDSKRIVALSSDALVAHLKFNDDVTDSAGSNNGTVTGTTTYVTGKVGKAFSFNGSSYITLANESNFDFERTDPFSVSLWLKTGTEQDIKMLVGNSEINTLGWHVWMRQGASGDDNGDIRFNLTNTYSTNEIQTRIQVLPMFDDTWHHLVWTYDGTSDVSGIHGYWDGVEISKGSGTNNLTSSILNNLPVSIGDTPNGGSRDYTGSMDDVRIYSRELDQSEVSIIYNGGTGTEEDLKPTDVQDNSILVEKDTAKRYWRTPESTSETESTGTYTWTGDIGTYDNNRQGFYVANTSSVVYGKTINSVSFWLHKTGSPTGTATVGVWSNSGSGSTYTLAHTFGTLDVSTLTGSFVKYTFDTGSHTLAVGDTVGIYSPTTNVSNTVEMQGSTSGQYDGVNTIRGRNVTSGWSPVTTHDIRFAITETIPATWTLEGAEFGTYYFDYNSDPDGLSADQTYVYVDTANSWWYGYSGTNASSSTGQYIDLGSELSDDWTMAFKVISNTDGNTSSLNAIVGLFVSSNTGTSYTADAHDFVTVWFNTDSSSRRNIRYSYGVNTVSNSSSGSVYLVDNTGAYGGDTLPDGTDITLYCVVNKSGTTTTAKLYTDKELTNQYGVTATNTNVSSANLRYIKLMSRSAGGSNNQVIVKIQSVQIKDGDANWTPTWIEG